MGFADSVRRLLASASTTTSGPPERAHGPPTSSNGASSHHLFWRLPTRDPVIEVAVTLEVIEAPSADRLYFWALQASFSDGSTMLGAAHLGLQHHPEYPGGGAANWGGYHDAASGRTGELPGSALRFPSTLRNPNTCDFAWRRETPYRLRIARVAEGWSGTITDLSTPTPEPIVLRTLYCGGDELRAPMVWTECFADCDAPAAAVRWSDLAVRTRPGAEIPVDRVTVNYQKITDGGCSTSDSMIEPAAPPHRDTAAIVQRTGVRRSTPGGSEIHLLS